MSEVQSVLIPRNIYTKKEAKRWIKKHKYKIKKVDITDRFYKIKISKKTFNNYQPKLLLDNSGIILLYGFNN